MLLEPRVSACIVMYHSGPSLLKAVECVLSSDIPIDLHLVDHSPKDPWADLVHADWPSVDIIEPGRNLGYGAGNNAALPRLKSEYHIIMNPDVTFDPTLISRMVAYMDAHKDIAVLTPRIFGEDGAEQFVPRRQPTVRYLLSGRLADHSPYFKAQRDAYTMADTPLTGPMSVQFATGCFMLIRTHLFYQLKGFDERFFLYHEDSDLSRRVLQRGQIVYHPDFCITHVWRRSSARSRRALLQHVLSTIRFFMKWGWSW